VIDASAPSEDATAPRPDGAGVDDATETTPASPAAVLDGARWDMKCSAPTRGDLCLVLPPGKTQTADCPQGGYTAVDKMLTFGGKQGTTYDVAIHVRGTAETGDYTGTVSTDADGFVVGGVHTSGSPHLNLSFDVSSPKQTYHFNGYKPGNARVETFDFTKTIKIDGGATIRMVASDTDCDMHRYCVPNSNPCQGYVIPGVTPAPMPFDGSFLQMNVASVSPPN